MFLVLHFKYKSREMGFDGLATGSPSNSGFLGLPPSPEEEFCFSLKCMKKLLFLCFSVFFFLYFWRAGVWGNSKINLELESFNF